MPKKIKLFQAVEKLMKTLIFFSILSGAQKLKNLNVFLFFFLFFFFFSFFLSYLEF